MEISGNKLMSAIAEFVWGIDGGEDTPSSINLSVLSTAIRLWITLHVVAVVVARHKEILDI